MSATASNLYIGTSGWSYPSGYGKWKGIVYPSRWGGDELAYYAERFPAVEVNASFYRMPMPETVRLWLERTPEEFLFTMKLFRKFTHPEFYAREEGQPPEITPEDIAAMRAVLDVPAARGRLGALLVQYPEFFSPSERAWTRLSRTLELFHDYPLAVELRHPGWNRPEVRQLLEAHAAARVRIDEPFFENLHDPTCPAGTLQYWRFHGRNTANWRKPALAAQRYEYLYDQDEITLLADSVRRHADPERRNFVFFNNHVSGMAVVNALMIAADLKAPFPMSKFVHMTNAYPQLRPLTGDAGGQMSLLG